VWHGGALGSRHPAEGVDKRLGLGVDLCDGDCHVGHMPPIALHRSGAATEPHPVVAKGRQVSRPRTMREAASARAVVSLARCTVTCARCWALLCGEGVEPSALPTARRGAAASPAAGTRSPAAPRAASLFQFHLPAGLLDRRVDLPNLLRQGIHLPLQCRHVNRGHPANLLHPVTLRRLRTDFDDAL